MTRLQSVGPVAMFVLMLSLGCGSAQPEPTPPVSGPEDAAPMTPPVAIDRETRTIAFVCGDTPLAIQVQDDAIALVLTDATHRLSRVVAASGAKYEATVNGETYTFWEQGGEATFTAGDRTYPTCQRVDQIEPPPAG